MLKYLKVSESLTEENGRYVAIHKWKHWDFYIKKAANEKTYQIDGPVLFTENCRYIDISKRYRNLNTAEKAIDSAIRDFLKYLKSKDVGE